ncbi:hypothetical protein BXY57_1361 [Thermoflavifilum aggregans]|uniref:Uncharacterized protein n=1 Tax=Thermoflavifilum aggregans TaxID=454188 RepID=A0A2M9CV59_9BACT|nr:hypothetical protein BXY57_1361 [Thermoflavifilum aggregans]
MPVIFFIFEYVKPGSAELVRIYNNILGIIHLKKQPHANGFTYYSFTGNH